MPEVNEALNNKLIPSDARKIHEIHVNKSLNLYLEPVRKLLENLCHKNNIF